MSRISTSARGELVAAVSDRYRSAQASEKRRILDEFVAVTGYHRKHAIRVLTTDSAMPAKRRTRKPRLYDEAVGLALVVLWEAADRICSKRLKPLLPILVPALERHGHLSLDPSVRSHLLKVSASTMDRMLAEPRAAAGGRRRASAAKPGVRRSIPIRTFADWNEPAPGYLEVDLVLALRWDGGGKLHQHAGADGYCHRLDGMRGASLSREHPGRRCGREA